MRKRYHAPWICCGGRSVTTAQASSYPGSWHSSNVQSRRVCLSAQQATRAAHCCPEVGSQWLIHSHRSLPCRQALAPTLMREAWMPALSHDLSIQPGRVQAPISQQQHRPLGGDHSIQVREQRFQRADLLGSTESCCCRLFPSTPGGQFLLTLLAPQTLTLHGMSWGSDSVATQHWWCWVAEQSETVSA